MPSIHDRDELDAHGQDSLHAEPKAPDEHADAVPVFELHDSTTLRLSAQTNARQIANLKAI